MNHHVDWVEVTSVNGVTSVTVTRKTESGYAVVRCTEDVTPTASGRVTKAGVTRTIEVAMNRCDLLWAGMSAVST